MLVLKIGGSMAEKAGSLIAELALLHHKGEKFVIVHGGAQQVSELERKLGREPSYVMSKEGFKSRHVDGQTLQNSVMAFGMVNGSLISMLKKHGMNAVGILGASSVLSAKRKILVAVEEGKEKVIRDNFSGKITKVDTKLLASLLNSGFVPVIAPVAMGEEHELLNVDGDRAAAEIAGALRAERLMLFTDVEGYFRNFPNDLVSTAKQSDIEAFQSHASAGMKRKLVAVGEALELGVPEVIISSGLKENPVGAALNGGGTHFTK